MQEHYYSGKSQLPTPKYKRTSTVPPAAYMMFISIFIIIFFHLWVAHCRTRLWYSFKELWIKILTRYYKGHIPKSHCALVSSCKQFWLLLKNKPFTLWPLLTLHILCVMNRFGELRQKKISLFASKNCRHQEFVLLGENQRHLYSIWVMWQIS